MIIITGPRQVGKTTLVESVLADSALDKPTRFIDVDNPLPNTVTTIITEADTFPTKDTTWLVRQWELARAVAYKSSKGLVLVFDEIQRIPRWSETIKGLWDADKASGLNMHIVLLGSSPLLVHRGLTESLTGRFELIRLGHWSFMEMHEAFGWSLDEYLYFGGYPGSESYIRDERRWREYVRDSLIGPSIEKDVFDISRVDKKHLLKHLFKLGCDYSGQIFTYSKMAEHLRDDGDKAHTNTIADYLELLMQAGLLAGLQMYSGNRLRLRASPPKLNVLNTALMSVETGYSFEAAKADRTYWGRLVESAVGSHLYNTGLGDCPVYYWRKSPVEVDFVLAKGRTVTAIEVKSGRTPTSVPGLHAFAEAFPGCKTLIVGEGGIDLSEFLSNPAAHWLE
ncbi:MAG: ATP-binding protein [Betaproteobacteria bacterium]|nr:ATP-binding protein [Betaproteobacteria bacterium]